MKDEQILKHLLNGNHLNDNELKKAQHLVNQLQHEINTRKL